MGLGGWRWQFRPQPHRGAGLAQGRTPDGPTSDLDASNGGADRSGLHVESLLENKTGTGWSIEIPKAGKLDSVSAFFEAAAGAGFEQGTALPLH